MWKYILKRLLMMIPVLLGVTFLVFFILNMTPGAEHDSRRSSSNHLR